MKEYLILMLIGAIAGYVHLAGRGAPKPQARLPSGSPAGIRIARGR
jgi:hypothetical protein